jgi:hypothetical protein
MTHTVRLGQSSIGIKLKQTMIYAITVIIENKEQKIDFKSRIKY